MAADELAEEATATALAMVANLGGWMLPEGHWTTVDGCLEAMLAAAAGGDAQALYDATLELELHSAVRATDADRGPDPRLPPPPATRDRVVRLVHALRSRPSDPSLPLRGNDDRRR